MSFFRSRWIEAPEAVRDAPSSGLPRGFRAAGVAAGLKPSGSSSSRIFLRRSRYSGSDGLGGSPLPRAAPGSTKAALPAGAVAPESGSGGAGLRKRCSAATSFSRSATTVSTWRRLGASGAVVR